MAYKNVFDRQVDRKFKFRGATKDPDILSRVIYTGEIVPAAGGRFYTITNVRGRMLNNNTDTGRTLDASQFTGRSRREVQQKLTRALESVSFTDSGDPLRNELAEAQRARNRSSAHTERTVTREPVQAEPQEKLVFGLKVGDPALGKIFEAACADWVRQHASEFDGSDMTPSQRAVAVERMQTNIRSMSRLLEQWALTGKIRVLTAQEVEDARVWLKQRHRWQPIHRKHGETIGREYFPEPDERKPEPAAKDPRSLSFEELRQIEKNRQRRVQRDKNLSNVRNGLGVVL